MTKQIAKEKNPNAQNTLGKMLKWLVIMELEMNTTMGRSLTCPLPHQMERHSGLDKGKHVLGSGIMGLPMPCWWAGGHRIMTPQFFIHALLHTNTSFVKCNKEVKKVSMVDALAVQERI
jgi:hypothetical protein